MDTSLIQSLFNFLSNNIFAIIYLFAIIEIFLIISIFRMMKMHESILLDVSDNLLKGFKDAPDQDSSQNIHEKIEATIDFIYLKLRKNPELKKDFIDNANSVSQRSYYSRHYKIEIYASIMSTLVQVFPLKTVQQCSEVLQPYESSNFFSTPGGYTMFAALAAISAFGK